MKKALLLLALLPAIAAAQIDNGLYGSERTSPAADPMLEKQAGSEDDSYQTEHFSKETAPPSRTSNFHTAASANGIAYGSMSTSTTEMNSTLSSQVSSGFMAITQRRNSNIEGTSLLGSITPIYFGLRYDFARMETEGMRWSQYVTFGGGPLIGIEYPQSTSFTNALGKLGFRWGAGAYAGIGSELMFTDGIGMYAQLEMTGFGFTAPLVDRTTYLGPSFSVGFNFFPQR